MSVADEIKKFKELLDMGAITQEEFEERKRKLIFSDNKPISENNKNKIEEIQEKKEEIKDTIEVRQEKETPINSIKEKIKKDGTKEIAKDFKDIIKEMFKLVGLIIRYLFALIFIIIGSDTSDFMTLLLGISLLPLVYTLTLKYGGDKATKEKVNKLAIIFPIVCIILMIIFNETNYFNEEKLDLSVGQNYNIELITTPTEYKITSTNEDVLSIENNIIKAKQEGIANVEISIADEVMDSIEINVKYLDLSDFELEINNSIDKDSIHNVQINCVPENASNKQVTLTSSNSKVVTIENGQILAHKPGDCIITATSYNNIVKEYQVTVVEPVTGVEITEPTCTMYVGDTKTLKTKISPNNATEKTLIWTTSDANIANVDNGVVVANSRGSATITATSINGISSSSTITVKEKSPITINNFKYTIDYVGGVEWTFSITNNTDKVINYVNLKWNCYNAVGDPIYDQISWENHVGLQYTGPLEPHKNSGTRRNSTKFYNSNYKKANISYVEVIYADGTNTVIQGNDLLEYEGLIK